MLIYKQLRPDIIALIKLISLDNKEEDKDKVKVKDKDKDKEPISAIILYVKYKRKVIKGVIAFLDLVFK